MRFDYVFFIPRSGRKYSHTNSYNFATTLISQDDHLTADHLCSNKDSRFPLPYKFKDKVQLLLETQSQSEAKCFFAECSKFMLSRELLNEIKC